MKCHEGIKARLWTDYVHKVSFTQVSITPVGSDISSSKWVQVENSRYKGPEIYAPEGMKV